MGAWGTGPLDNDAAADFVDSVKRARKGNRLAKVDAALQAYIEFDRKLQAGENVSVLDEAEIEELRRSRAQTLDWYASVGQAAPIDLLPQLASEEAWDEYVRELSAPEQHDGSSEAFRAIAGAQLVVDALRRSAGPLSGFDRSELGRLAALAVDVLPCILGNEPFRATWATDDYASLAATLQSLVVELHTEA